MGNVSDFDIDDEPVGLRGDTYKVGKKLFRDADDRVISGVCAGIAHYFDIEPRWIRLIFILTLIFAGSGLPVYIILWIVIPIANTRADKMAMKGEPINIQNFKKNFDEEVEGLKNGLNRAQHEARPIIDRLGRFIRSAVTVFIKFIGAFIVFTGVITLFALFITLIIFLGYWNTSQLNIFPFTIVNPAYRSIFTLSAFILVFIPLAALVMLAIRVLISRFAVSKTVYFGMLIVWLAGLGIGIYYASKVGSEFNEEANFAVTTILKPSDVYFLKLNTNQYLSREDSVQYNVDPDNFKGRIIIKSRHREFNQPRSVKLEIIRGDVKNPILIQEFSAKGADFEEALATAQRAKHRFIQSDSLLLFDGNTYLERGELWRDQSVNLILKIPENTTLHIEGKLNRYIESYNLWECRPKEANSDYLSKWVMTSEGLKCKNDSLQLLKD
jgi:phage shock protein PspC (stress-responsive transcriptional regulator)